MGNFVQEKGSGRLTVKQLTMQKRINTIQCNILVRDVANSRCEGGWIHCFTAHQHK